LSQQLSLSLSLSLSLYRNSPLERASRPGRCLSREGRRDGLGEKQEDERGTMRKEEGGAGKDRN